MAIIHLNTALKGLDVTRDRVTDTCTNYYHEGTCIATSYQHDHNTALLRLSLFVARNDKNVKYVVISYQRNIPIIELFDHCHADAFNCAKDKHDLGFKVCVYLNCPSSDTFNPMFAPVNNFMTFIEEYDARSPLSNICTFKVV
jgi:hypothetical protein